MKNKITSLILVVSMILSLSAYEVRASQTPAFEEGFNSCATNAIPDSVTVKGKCSGAVEYEKRNKGLLFKELRGKSGVVVSPLINIGETNRFYFSFDILSSEDIDGNVNLVSGTTSVGILTIKGSSVQTYNKKYVSTLGRNTKKSITVEFDSKYKEYNIYVDKKLKVSGYYHSDLKEKMPVSGFEMVFSGKSGEKVIVDNLIAGVGEFDFSFIKKLDSIPLNTDETEEKVYEKYITDNVYQQATFDYKAPGNLYGKDNILEMTADENGNNVLLFERTGTQDFHWDYTAVGYDSNVICYQFDIKRLSDSAQFNFCFIDTDRKYWYPIKGIGGGTVQASSTTFKLKKNEWQTITIYYDWFDSVYSVYVDGVKVTDDMSVDFEYEKATTIRWHVSGTPSGEKFYLDNFVVYGGDEVNPKILTEGRKISIDLSGKKSVYPSESSEIKLLDGKVGYHLRSNVVYKDGIKTKLKNSSYISDGSTYVSAEFFETAFGLVYNKEENTLGDKSLPADIAIVQNQITYLPLRTVCTDILGKKLWFDNSVSNGGAVIVSDENFVPGDGANLQSLNDFLFYERPNKERIGDEYSASSLAGTHPRIMATSSDFERIKSEITTDPRKKAWYKKLISRADNLVADPTPVEHVLTDGIRLMYVAQDFQSKVVTLAMAYRLSGDRKYADRAWLDMNAAATFPDWNPSHHMDVGILSVAYAIGYDWLYDYYTPEQRKIIEEGAFRNCIYDYNLAIMSPSSRMSTAMTFKNNHGAIMNAGAAVAGMAFADVYPEESFYLIANGIRGLEYSAINYAPDGAWFEGPAYASLAMEYFAYMFASLDTVFGDLYSFDCIEGMNKVSDFILYIQSPMGSFELSEGGSSTEVAYDSSFLWFANYFGRGELISSLYSSFDGNIKDNTPLALLWYDPQKVAQAKELSLDMYAAKDQVITMRDTWQKDNKVFVGIKGSGKNMEHKHLNMGTFAFYANGVKWATDIGYDDYNLPGFFSTSYGGERWTYYRQRAEAHNCLVIDPDTNPDMIPTAEAKFVKTDFKPRGGIAIVDMKDSYGDKVESARRGFFFTDERQSLAVRDEVVTVPGKERTVYWFMQTGQNVEIDGKRAVVTDKTNPENKLIVEFLCSEEFTLSAAQSDPLETSPKPQGIANNKGKTRIMLKTSANGQLTVTAKLTPLGVAGSDISGYDCNMDLWQIPDGEIKGKPYLDSLVIEGIEYRTDKQYITHLMGDDAVGIPDIYAVSATHRVDIKKAENIDDKTEIIVTDSTDESNKWKYIINYSIHKRVNLPGFEEYNIYGVSASSEPQPENNAFNVIDRDYSTRWSADGVGENLVIDLNEVKDINKVILAFYLGDKRQTYLNISVSEDGENFTQVFSGSSSGKTVEYEEFFIGAHRARYVKIEGMGTTEGTWNSITEVAVGKAV